MDHDELLTLDAQTARNEGAEEAPDRGKRGRGLFSHPRLLAFLIVLLVLGAAAAFLYTRKITTVKYVGAVRMSEAELTDRIFEEPNERRLVYAIWNDHFGTHKELPFIERYEMDFQGLDTVEINLYEKNIVACVEYMGSYMYFDKDGVIVESTAEHGEDVPVITGLTFRQIVLHSVLKIEREETFEEILNLTQLLRKYELDVDRIMYDAAGNIVFALDDIKVRLGSARYMEGKISELTRMLPQLKGLCGTLYLDTYQETLPPDSYVFRKEEKVPETVPEESVPAQEESTSTAPETPAP